MIVDQDLHLINIPKIPFAYTAHCGIIYLWRLPGPTSCWKQGLRL